MMSYESNAITSKRWLIAAALLFLAVKFFWIFAPVPAMGVPRLGDDALTYLWVGSSSVFSPQGHLPAIQDIIDLRKSVDQVDGATEFQRARVTMRTTSVQSSPWMILNGVALATGLDSKYAFAVVEAFTAIVLAFCIAFSVSSLFGNSAAAVTLLLLTFAILPNQGVHYLVASVFTMALSLMMWSLVVKCNRGVLWLSGITALVLLSHPIGKVYVLIAFAVLVGMLLVRTIRLKESGIQFGALLAGMVVWQLVERLSGAKAAPTSGMGGLNFSEVGSNWQGYLVWCKTLVINQPFIALLAVMGLLVVLLRPMRDIRVSLLLFMVFAAMLSTVIIDLPGYPGELPSRIMIPVIILSMSAATQWIIGHLGNNLLLKRLAVVSVIVVGVAQIPYFKSYLYANLNYRDSGYHVIDETSLKKEIDRFPSDTTILWAETDIALMSGLLNGAGRFHAVPLPMLKDSTYLKGALNNSGTAVLATTVPPYLNGLSALGTHSLESRYYGFGFNVFRKIHVNVPLSVSARFFIRVTDGNTEDIQISVQSDGSHCQIKPYSSIGSQSRWIEVDKCHDVSQIEITSRNPNLKITGFSIDSPREAIRWPWGIEGFEVTVYPINKKKHGFKMRFDWRSILGKRNTELLEGRLGQAEIISDSSGVLFVRLKESSTVKTSSQACTSKGFLSEALDTNEATLGQRII